jgi:cell division protein FtsW (lipid II flippase)
MQALVLDRRAGIPTLGQPSLRRSGSSPPAQTARTASTSSATPSADRVVLLGWILLIVAEPDLGTSVVILLISGVMVFAAGLDYRYLAVAVSRLFLSSGC